MKLKIHTLHILNNDYCNGEPATQLLCACSAAGRGVSVAVCAPPADSGYALCWPLAGVRPHAKTTRFGTISCAVSLAQWRLAVSMCRSATQWLCLWHAVFSRLLNEVWLGFCF